MATAQLQVEVTCPVTNGATNPDGTVTFTNNGTSPITIELVLAAFRGFQPDTPDPCSGAFAVIDAADHTLVSGGGSPLIGTIVGTPIDMEVVHIFDSGGGGGGGSCGGKPCVPITPLGPAGAQSSSSGAAPKAIAFVTSVVIENGSCSGGGGGFHRKVLVTDTDLDRAFFGTPIAHNPVELSCMEFGGQPALLDDIGIAVSDDDRIFVVSPDTGELVSMTYDAASGELEPQNMRRVLFLAPNAVPTDVEVYTTLEMDRKVIVTGTLVDGVTDPGLVQFYIANSRFASPMPLGFFQIEGGSDPVAVVTNEAEDFAYVALQGRDEMAVIDLVNESLVGERLAVAGTVRRLTVQKDPQTGP